MVQQEREVPLALHLFHVMRWVMVAVGVVQVGMPHDAPAPFLRQANRPVPRPAIGRDQRRVAVRLVRAIHRCHRALPLLLLPLLRPRCAELQLWDRVAHRGTHGSQHEPG